jgi:integrase
MRGHIRRRGNKWCIVVYLGRGQVRDRRTGELKLGEKSLWRSFERRAEAQKALAQYISMRHRGEPVLAPTKQSVGEYLEAWLRGHAPNVGPTTAASYRDTIRVHLVPRLGLIRLTGLQPQDVRDYIAEKLAAGLSSTTVRYHVAVLKNALAQALRDGLIGRNPCAFVRAPRKRRLEMRALDEEQLRLFLAEARRASRYYLLYLMAVTTGMREGELLGLRWQDLDLVGGIAGVPVVRVARTFYRLGGRRCGYCKDRRKRRAPRETFDAAQCTCIKGEALFKEPKTASARRELALPLSVAVELRGLRAAQDKRRKVLGRRYEDHGLVFCQDNGRPLHAHNIVRRDLRKVLQLEGLRKAARARGVPEDALPKGLPRIRFHDLRHTAATLHLKAGTHPKVVQEMLGHSTISMTVDTYSHVLPGLQARAVADLEARLFGSAVPAPADERGA